MSERISSDEMIRLKNFIVSCSKNNKYSSLRMNSDDSDTTLQFVIDSGSDAHLTNCEGVFVPGSLRDCNVTVIGINGSSDDKTFHVVRCGDVVMHLSRNMNVLLKEVLHVPNAAILESSDDSVLVSVRKLAKQNNISTKFDVNDISFYRGDYLINTFSSLSTKIYSLSDYSACTAAALLMESEMKKSETSLPNKIDHENKKKMITHNKNSKKKKSKDKVKNERRKYSARKVNTKAKLARIKLGRLLHGRMHFGKTARVRRFLMNAYGSEIEFSDDEPCDACMWSKGKFTSVPKYSHRKAKRVGERLHYDVFTSSYKADDGSKYLLVIIDEYSGYIFAYGMKKKSEVSELVKMTVVTIEKHLREKVITIEVTSEVKECVGVACLRSDNAGENVSREMRSWCAARGTRIETTIPHTPHQDGKAERLGGAVWQGGACLRYGGNLPQTDWLHCCLAYVYVRNRLPTASCLSSKHNTPYEAYNDIVVSPRELVDNFVTIGCLCYVLVPHSLRSGKPKKAYRAMLLGYSDNVTGQKGYIVRNLSTGKICSAAHNQVKCYESTLVFNPAREYDAWLYKRMNAIADKEERDSTSESDIDDVVFDDDCESESDSNSSDSNDIEEISDHDYSDDDYVFNEPNEYDDNAYVSDHEPVSDDDATSSTTGSGVGVKEAVGAVEASLPSLEPVRGTGTPVSISDAASDSPEVIDESGDNDEEIEVIDESESASGMSDTSDEIEKGEYEVLAISDMKGRGRHTKYRTEWKDGSPTWEPASTFKVDETSGTASYLPVFDLFKENKARGIVGARASDCESDSETRVSDATRGSESESAGVAAGTGSAASAAAEERTGVGEEAPVEQADPGVSEVVSSTEESDEVGENEVTSHSSSTDSPNTVTIEHVTLALRTVLALAALEKAGVVVPQTRREAKSGKYWKHFSDAEDDEINSFSELDVWELVEKPKGANVVGTKWVYDVKINPDGSINRYKARLVAQGFSQKEGIDFTETFAPTMHIKTLRLLLTIAARNNIVARVYDISTAFLHACLDEEVYVKQPPGHVVKGKENYVYKLKKAMYGLKNAPKAFSDHFMNILSDAGFKQSTKDSCLWYLRRGDHFVYYLFHVDDILVVSNHDTLRNVCFNMLEKKLRIRDEGEVKKFLSIEIERRSDGSYSMSQSKYIERLAKRFCIDDMSRAVETPGQYGQKLLPVSDSEMTSDAKQLPYQELVGGLLYACKTRPDIAYALSDVSRFMSKWSVTHYKAALRILRYLYTSKDRAIVIAADAPMQLHVYVDANYGDDRESDDSDSKWKSQGGFLVFFSSSLVAWRSRRHKTRSLSSMESEYMEASEAAKEVLFFRVMLEELEYKQDSPTIMYEDNKACIQYSKNNTSHDRTKHIDIRAYHLRDCVRNGIIKLMHVDTSEQLADMLTKHQLKHIFLNHVSSMFSGFSEPKTAKIVNRVSTCHCLPCFVATTSP